MTTTTRHELLRLATHDVLTLKDLRLIGINRGQLRTLLRRAWLFERHRGVYLTTDRPSHQTLSLAAVRHCGADALTNAWSATLAWDLVDAVDGYPWVMVPAHRMTHGARGVRVVRSRRPDAGWTRDLVPVTTLHRTIDDVARRTTVSSLKAILGRAERRHALRLDALYDEATSVRLKRTLETYVAGRALTDSELEARFFDIVSRTSLSKPDMQRRQAGGRVDFLFAELDLIVEVDGYGTHRGRIAFVEDRRRDRAHWRAGRQTLRYTWDDVVLMPDQIVADLRLAADRVA